MYPSHAGSPGRDLTRQTLGIEAESFVFADPRLILTQGTERAKLIRDVEDRRTKLMDKLTR